MRNEIIAKIAPGLFRPKENDLLIDWIEADGKRYVVG
jgi:hypothetical protein